MPTEFIVDPSESGEKLDRLVARHGNVSRRLARTWIARGLVRVNGKPVRILTRPVRERSRVVIEDERGAAQEREPASASAQEVRVLHLDSSIVVVNKPAGLLSETDRIGSVSLENVVPRVLAARGERQRDVWLVHRLDAGTSGVIVMARTPAATRALNATFRDGGAEKRYLALCAGRLAEARDVDAPIARADRVRHKVDPAGKPAFTRLIPLNVGLAATLVEARPRTGRTHQIRVHLAHSGHPILGDRSYGGPAYTSSTPPRAIGRPMLHAWQLRLPHPKSGETLQLRADPPIDFIQLARELDIWNADLASA